MNDFKVYFAALLGFGAPGMNLFIERIEPFLNSLVLLGQFSVAVASTVYIFAKWKKLRKPDSDRDENP